MSWELRRGSACATGPLLCFSVSPLPSAQEAPAHARGKPVCRPPPSDASDFPKPKRPPGHQGGHLEATVGKGMGATFNKSRQHCGAGGARGRLPLPAAASKNAVSAARMGVVVASALLGPARGGAAWPAAACPSPPRRNADGRPECQYRFSGFVVVVSGPTDPGTLGVSESTPGAQGSKAQPWAQQVARRGGRTVSLSAARPFVGCHRPQGMPRTPKRRPKGEARDAERPLRERQFAFPRLVVWPKNWGAS